MLKYKSFSWFLATGVPSALLVIFGFDGLSDPIFGLVSFLLFFLLTHLYIWFYYGVNQEKRSPQSTDEVQNTDELQNTAQSFDYQLALQRSIIVWGGVSLLFDFAYAIYVMGTSGGAGSGLSITDILLPALFISTLFITLGFFYNLNVVKEERKCPKCSAEWSMLCRESILTDTSIETHNRKEQERKVTNNRTYHRDIFYEIDCTYSHFDEFHECIKCRYEEIRKRIESSEMQHTKKVTAVGEWTWSRY